MLLQDFINKLEQAGWEAVRDAQHSKIMELHKELFPVVAKLEAELKDTENDLYLRSVGQSDRCKTINDSKVNDGIKTN